MAVDVEFLSFDDVIAHGIDPSIDVIINCGLHGTASSGGERWSDPRLVTAIRSWVADGGGMVGVGEPTATPHQGRYFQLADCFGVDREMSQSLSVDKYHHGVATDHFITADVSGPLDFGESTRDVYALDERTQVLEYAGGDVHAAAREAGRGRAVYLAGLPFSTQNTRLLLRSLYWAAGREADLATWFATNPECEAGYYPDAGVYCVANLSDRSQTTTVHLAGGRTDTIRLGPHELVWSDVP
jgi:1,3-beta-galactosyl-N-acetylhexosamine phosphorylase